MSSAVLTGSLRAFGRRRVFGKFAGRIDDGPWVGLESSNDGHWRARLAGDRLTKGGHTLEVVALTADGTEGQAKSISWSIQAAVTLPCPRAGQ